MPFENTGRGKSGSFSEAQNRIKQMVKRFAVYNQQSHIRFSSVDQFTVFLDPIFPFQDENEFSS